MEIPTDSFTNKLYNLSYRINSDGFSLSIHDESKALLSSKKIETLIYSLTTEEIIKLLTEETLLNYHTVRIICESDNYTFIPTPLFKQEEAVDLLQFQSKHSKNDQIIINKIPKWDTINVFSIPKTLYIAITHFFPKAIIEHQISCFLSEGVKLQSESIVYCWIRFNIMDVVVLSNGGLLLINSFSFNTPEDFTYYTLNLYDKLSLDIENCNVVLFNADKKPELQKTLEKYVNVIKK